MTSPLLHPSVRELMSALAPAFRSVDYIAGLNLNYRECCWVQYGNEEHESLRTWISENCEEFRDMQVVRHAKYVGTMIGPDGNLHRWTAHRIKFIQRVMKINASTRSLVERLCEIKIYAISVLNFIGSACAPDQATLKAENHALQCTTAGPYNAFPSNLLAVGSVCGLGPDLVGIHSLSLAARYRVAACSSILRRGLEKINEARGHNCTPLFALSPAWEHEFLFPSMTFPNAFDVVCQLDRDDTLDEVPQSKKQKIATGLLLDKLLALGYSLVSFVFCVMGCVQHGDFTLSRTITLAVLDAQMSLTLSLITMSVPGCITSFFLSGDMQR